MKKIIILMITLANVINASCQDNEKLLDYFPDIRSEDTIIISAQLWRARPKKEIDTILALKYFFDNKVKNMHDIEEGYNADENTYIYTPYTKKVRPLYKKTINKNIYLLCYLIKYYMYLSFYNYDSDKIEQTLYIADFSNEGDIFTWSTIFPNNYIVTIQSIDKTYYILTKIDYESRKFVELKKIETPIYHTYNELESNAFEALGISETGELLEDSLDKKSDLK
jgi:hypothetical protein